MSRAGRWISHSVVKKAAKAAMMYAITTGLFSTFSNCGKHPSADMCAMHEQTGMAVRTCPACWDGNNATTGCLRRLQLRLVGLVGCSVPPDRALELSDAHAGKTGAPSPPRCSAADQSPCRRPTRRQRALHLSAVQKESRQEYIRAGAGSSARHCRMQRLVSAALQKISVTAAGALCFQTRASPWRMQAQARHLVHQPT